MSRGTCPTIFVEIRSHVDCPVRHSTLLNNTDNGFIMSGSYERNSRKVSHDAGSLLFMAVYEANVC